LHHLTVDAQQHRGHLRRWLDVDRKADLGLGRVGRKERIGNVLRPAEEIEQRRSIKAASNAAQSLRELKVLAGAEDLGLQRAVVEGPKRALVGSEKVDDVGQCGILAIAIEWVSVGQAAPEWSIDGAAPLLTRIAGNPPHRGSGGTLERWPQQRLEARTPTDFLAVDQRSDAYSSGLQAR